MKDKNLVPIIDDYTLIDKDYLDEKIKEYLEKNPEKAKELKEKIKESELTGFSIGGIAQYEAP